MREPEWETEVDFRLDGVAFGCRVGRDRFAPSADHFCIVKQPASVRSYVELCRELSPRRILEVGMWSGGSAAFLALLTEPDRLVGVERSTKARAALDDLVDRRGWHDRVRVALGTDQADREALGTLLTEEFGTDGIDLVIDDASHRLDLSRETFNLVFPRLRPGGRYVLEDWTAAHRFGDPYPEHQSLARLVLEATLAHARRPEAIARLEVNEFWVAVVRGEADLDPDTFDVRRMLNSKARELLSVDGVAATSPDPGPAR